MWYIIDSAQNRGTARFLSLLLLYYHAAFPCSFSEPHGGRFDANDTKRSPISGDAATRKAAARKELLKLNTRAKKREHHLITLTKMHSFKEQEPNSELQY